MERVEAQRQRIRKDRERSAGGKGGEQRKTDVRKRLYKKNAAVYDAQGLEKVQE